jgi:hypothetical protein
MVAGPYAGLCEARLQDAHTRATSRLQDLRQPELMYRALGCKLAVGMPFKDLATSDSLFLRDIPPADDKDARLALSRLAVRDLERLLQDSKRACLCRTS